MSLSRFFIDRPIVAWVMALIISIAGVLSISRLPISQYPVIAPPAVTISAVYPGAAARTAEESVTQIIEQAMTGLDGLLYMSSTSDSYGGVNVTLTFASGTDPDIAQVQAQNKLQLITPLLPSIVQQYGLNVTKQNANFLMGIGFISEDNSMQPVDVADYLATNVIERLNRLPGVGSVQLFGSKYAMRIWLDPDKLKTYSLQPSDIIAAVRAENAQVSVGQLGDLPSVPGQQLNATIISQGRLQTPEQFRAIALRTNASGSTLRLGDVARVERGSSDYTFTARYNGGPASGLGVTLGTNANALSTVRVVTDTIRQMEPDFPHGLKAFYPYDTTPFVRESIKEVIKTLSEAVGLVVLVMFLFLQNLRATLIPTIAVPVVLLGTFGVLAVFGYSINMLTMFAVVLAIGLLVDDAIVVVENVERLMREQGLSPVEATRRSMDQITGALIGIATVLAAVFLPMAFLEGSTGVIYRQFSITIVSAMVLSVIVALSLTPALCATLLKPAPPGAHGPTSGFLGKFNSGFNATNLRVQSVVGRIVRRTGRMMLVYGAIVAIMVVLFLRLPTAFLPDEDQGYLFATVQAPVGATVARTVKALAQVEDYFLHKEQAAVKSIFMVTGYGFGGGGQNSGFGFVLLRDWKDRPGAALTAQAVSRRAYGGLSGINDAMAFAFAPPPVNSLGNSAGFNFYLKDNGGQGHSALLQARNQFLMLASQSKLLANVRPNGQDDAPQFRLDIDPERVGALGVNMADVNDTLGIAWGGRYIDDFVDGGRVKRVYLQSDAPFRMLPSDFNRWYVRNAAGGMVPVSAFTRTSWEYGSPRLERYNGVSAVNVNGEAAPGVSSGAAMQEVEHLVGQLPKGFGVEWTGQSYEERAAGAQTPALYTLSLVVVFLCLAALYESWSIPVAILLAVPLGIIGAVLATSFAGLARDIYFQVAVLTTVGLASKNAILIVEFAKEYLDQGMGAVEAALHAVHDRLRPILMTSLAFGLGVLPLALATGAGAGAQRAIGTGVVGGMVAGTFLGIFLIPLFFVVIERLLERMRPAKT